MSTSLKEDYFPKNLTYRQASLEDAAQLASLHSEVWSETYSSTPLRQAMSGNNFESRYSFWRSALLEPSRWVTVCMAGNSVVGFISLLERNQREAEISALYLSRYYHGLGVGAHLFKQAFDEACAKGYELLSVRVLKDLPANHFYRRMGGKATATEKSEFLGVAVDLVYYCWGLCGDPQDLDR